MSSTPPDRFDDLFDDTSDEEIDAEFDGIASLFTDAESNPAAALLDQVSTTDKPLPYDRLLRLATETALAIIDRNGLTDPGAVVETVLHITNAAVDGFNIHPLVDKSDKLAHPKRVGVWQLAQVLMRQHHLICITPDMASDREYDILAMYDPHLGLYTASETEIRTAARAYDAQLSLQDFKELTAILQEQAPRRLKTTHPDLMPVANGIVNYSCQTVTVQGATRTLTFEPKQIAEFTPELVFLAKAAVSYHGPELMEPVHRTCDDGTDWEICAWVEDLFEDPELSTLFWEILGAVLRPFVPWDKTAWFYSEIGSNGKGTTTALMRNMLGPRTHTSIPLSEFGKDFALEPLVHANAIIVDENDVGTFIDKAANLKAIVTGDVIQINRKFRAPIAYRFKGFMVQCLNEFPRVKDKSDSFYRRQLFVPFHKTFTGIERREIKEVFLADPEVLEYALWYVVNRAGAQSPGNYYKLSEPKAATEVLDSYKLANDPVRTFWDEMRDEFVWDRLPLSFLYDAYRGWFPKSLPSGSPVSRQAFGKDLLAALRTDKEWFCEDPQHKVRPDPSMSLPEPLILELDMKAWMNPHASPKSKDYRTEVTCARAVLKPNYRGVVQRTIPRHNADIDGD